MFAIEEPGEYRTRDGRKAVILGYNPYGSLYRRWIGYVGEQTSEWSDEGAYQPGSPSDRDIAGPWEGSSYLGQLVDDYCDPRAPAHADVTLQHIPRAIVAEIAGLKARVARRN